MPRYVYKCLHCEGYFEVDHGMTENWRRCILCGQQGPERVPQMPYIKRAEPSKDKKVGDETKAAIEANRELLEEAKKEAKETHLPETAQPKKKTKRRKRNN
tara:strand:+ start:380 stop:682 length:303 start_codon:yes stop_codon:yes gene_type:complete